MGTVLCAFLRAASASNLLVTCRISRTATSRPSSSHLWRAQGSDGGAIYVENSSSAKFDVTGTTSFEGNTVQPGFQGGAVFAAGKVRLSMYSSNSSTGK